MKDGLRSQEMVENLKQFDRVMPAVNDSSSCIKSTPFGQKTYLVPPNHKKETPIVV
jgi:hypothetical protein